MNDRYGLPLTCASAAAANAYRAAVDNLLAAGPDLAAGFQSALALDPDFALAHIGHARCLITFGHAAQARQVADTARQLSKNATQRERQHVEALALVVDGKSVPALAAIRAHLAQFPRDAMVLQPATGTFGLIAFSGRDDYEAQWLALMQEMAPYYSDDWWFNSIHAFAECEAGQLDAAHDRVLAAYATAPHNANAAHVITHVLYEQNRIEQGAQFLRQWLHDYPTRGLLRGHLAWHLALWEVALGNDAQAWSWFKRETVTALHDPAVPAAPLSLLADAVSWLWRTELAGHAIEFEHWRAVAVWAKQRFPNAGGYLADLHCSLAYLRGFDTTVHSDLNQALHALREQRPVSGFVQQCGVGFAAFASQDFARAIERLASSVERSALVGGSKAQRELISRTLLAAYRRCGDQVAANALIEWRPQLRVGV